MKLRADVFGILPKAASVIRLVGAVLIEANNERHLQHRYRSVEMLAEVATGDDADNSAPCAARRRFYTNNARGLSLLHRRQPQLPSSRRT